jgi:hypothetical protein
MFIPFLPFCCSSTALRSMGHLFRTGIYPDHASDCPFFIQCTRALSPCHIFNALCPDRHCLPFRLLFFYPAYCCIDSQPTDLSSLNLCFHGVQSHFANRFENDQNLCFGLYSNELIDGCFANKLNLSGQSISSFLNLTQRYGSPVMREFFTQVQ